MPETAPPSLRVCVAEVLARWRADAPPLPVVIVPLADARGAVLAEPLIADRPSPAVPIARLDGRAVIAIETSGASPYTPTDLSASHPVRAGDPVPAPFDAVAATDEATARTAEVAIAPGTNLRRIGEDAPCGDLLLAAGSRLGARELAVAAAIGRETLAVRRGRAVIGTGDADARLPAVLAGLLTAHGFVAPIVGLAEAATIAERGVDLAVFFGGEAIGAADPGWHAAFGDARRPAYGRPALRPGENAVAGRIGPSPTLVLPSRLDDVVATALALLLPLVEAATGAEPTTGGDRRPLAGKLVSAIGFTELALLRPTADGGGWTPLAVGAIGIAAIAGATHWTLLSPGREGFDAATPLDARPWPDGL